MENDKVLFLEKKTFRKASHGPTLLPITDLHGAGTIIKGERFAGLFDTFTRPCKIGRVPVFVDTDAFMKVLDE